jgi:FemAB family protein
MLITDSFENILCLDNGAKLRAYSKELWDQIFNSLPYRPLAYSNASIDYQFAYQCGHGGSWEDISLIIYWNKKPAALWPLSFSIKDGQPKLTSHGAPVLPPLFVDDCPSISRKHITKSCLDIADSISNLKKICSWESSESNVNAIGMSEWHIESMSRGAVCHLRHDLFLDLRPDLTEIKKKFRKSYKSLISSGERIWKVDVLDSFGNESAWKEFRDFHAKVSGRITRTDETWDLQYKELVHQKAFLISLRNNSGKMVGGGFFNFTQDECLYAVGAYDRTLFDKPLGHVVQYRAIEELKKRGVIWYKIGERCFIADHPIPTSKEISISDFKHGFASYVFPRFNLTHKLIGKGSNSYSQ